MASQGVLSLVAVAESCPTVQDDSRGSRRRKARRADARPATEDERRILRLAGLGDWNAVASEILRCYGSTIREIYSQYPHLWRRGIELDHLKNDVVTKLTMPNRGGRRILENFEQTESGLEGYVAVTAYNLVHDYGGRKKAGPASAVTATPAPGAASAALSDLRAIPGKGQVTLSWSPSAEDSTAGSHLYRYRRDGGEWTDWNGVTGDSASLRVELTGLTNGKDYEFQVRTREANGRDVTSAVTATPTYRCGPPATPDLKGTPDKGQVTLSWTGADWRGFAAIGYQHRYRPQGGRWTKWQGVAGGADARGVVILY